MPAAAIPAWALITSAVAPAAAGVAGSVISSRGARKAADASTAAANYAADREREAADAALSFQQQQATNAYQNSETTRRGNYDQWASREHRLGSIFQQRGWGDREIPAYVPGVAPDFSSVGATLAGRTPQAANQNGGAPVNTLSTDERLRRSGVRSVGSALMAR